MASSDRDALYVFSVISIVYSLLVGGGAGYAYYSKRSMPSLVSGGTIAATLFVTSLLSLFFEKDIGVWAAMTIVTAVTFLFAAGRFWYVKDDEGKRKVMPMGVLAVLSVIVLFFDLIALLLIVT